MTILSYLVSDYVRFRSVPLIFVLLLSQSIYAQIEEQFVISGFVTDSITGTPVPYANIYLASNITIGTATDSTGSFMLFVDKGYKSYTINISSIGYKTIKRMVFPNNSMGKINLPPTPILLREQEISERRLKPLEILRSAFLLKDSLFSSKDVKYTVLYTGNAAIGEKDYALDVVMEQYFLFNEGRMSVDVNILEKRILAPNSTMDLNKILFGMGTWNFYDYGFVCDLANRECASRVNIKKISLSEYNDHEVLKIDYQIESNKKSKIHNYGGTIAKEVGIIYINAINNAILRHEIMVDFDSIIKPKYHGNKLRNNIYSQHLNLVRNYRQTDNNHQLSYYKIIRQDIMATSKKKIERITSIHTLNILEIKFSPLNVPEHVIPFINLVPFRQEFWKKWDRQLSTN